MVGDRQDGAATAAPSDKKLGKITSTKVGSIYPTLTGVELDRSLLAKWVGHSAALLQPLVDALRRHVIAATKLHADDTPVPVLAPGNGKTKTGRLWVYVRDDRASGDATAPAV